MKGKRTFTIDEDQKIELLFREYGRTTGKNLQPIREKIRKIGFYISDWSDDSDGFSIIDYQNLKNSGRIRIQNTD